MAVIGGLIERFLLRRWRASSCRKCC